MSRKSIDPVRCFVLAALIPTSNERHSRLISLIRTSEKSAIIQLRLLRPIFLVPPVRRRNAVSRQHGTAWTCSGSSTLVLNASKILDVFGRFSRQQTSELLVRNWCLSVPFLRKKGEGYFDFACAVCLHQISTSFCPPSSTILQSVDCKSPFPFILPGSVRHLLHQPALFMRPALRLSLSGPATPVFSMPIGAKVEGSPVDMNPCMRHSLEPKLSRTLGSLHRIVSSSLAWSSPPAIQRQWKWRRG